MATLSRMRKVVLLPDLQIDRWIDREMGKQINIDIDIDLDIDRQINTHTHITMLQKKCKHILKDVIYLLDADDNHFEHLL